MKRITILAAVVCAALGIAGSASAIVPPDGVPDGLGPWADYVVTSNQGCAFQPPNMTTCIPVAANRSDPQTAVGPAATFGLGNNDPIPLGVFFSLGFADPSKGDASITLGFDNPVCNTNTQPDLAIDVVEVTKLPYPEEKAAIYVSATGAPGSFVFAGTITRDGSVSMPASVPVANFVKVVDISNRADFIGATGAPADGFDLDGVRALNQGTCGNGTGTIEICKSSLHGMYNKSFQFSLNSGAPFTVRGGRCTGPIPTIEGVNRVVELPSSPPTDVESVSVTPSSRSLFNDLPNRTAIVKVPAGTTAANETKVTFVNVPGGGPTGDLKICKLTQTPTLLDDLFTFHVNGGPAFSTPASDANDTTGASWQCTPAGTFAQGTIVTVKEDIPTGIVIDSIDSNPSSALQDDFNTGTGVAHFLIGPGTTVVKWDNEPEPLVQTGTIEVCKYGWDPDAYGGQGARDDSIVAGHAFTFTVDDGFTSQDVTTFGGGCTDAINVAAGPVQVTEHPDPGYTLNHVGSTPPGRVLDSNQINGTGLFDVPVGDDTVAAFYNQRVIGWVKVCKRLGDTTDSLANTPFSLTVQDLTASTPGHPVYISGSPFSVTVPAGSPSQCTDRVTVPVGHVLSISEDTSAPQFEAIKTTCDSNVTVQANTVLNIGCTNTAQGKLEICKQLVDTIGFSRSFYFRIDGGPKIELRVGALPSGYVGNACTQPQFVSVGTHVVSEEQQSCTNNPATATSPPTQKCDSDFVLGGIEVNPESAVHGTSASLTTRSVAVDVPYAYASGSNGDEVQVTFWNFIRTSVIKICKNKTSAGTGNNFQFLVTHGAPTNPLAPNPETITVPAGGPCIQSTLNDWVIDPNTGKPAVDKVQETGRDGGAIPPLNFDPAHVPTATEYYISKIVVQGFRSGINTVTTNCVAGPPSGPAFYAPAGYGHCSQISTAELAQVVWNPGGGTAPVTNNPLLVQSENAAGLSFIVLGLPQPNVNTVTIWDSPGN